MISEIWGMDSFLFLTYARNTSSFKTGNLIYIRPYSLSVLVQPSDGEVGKELIVQPQLVFLDKQVLCAQVTVFTWGGRGTILCLEHVSDSIIIIIHVYRTPTMWQLVPLEHLTTFIIFLPLHSLLSFHFLEKIQNMIMGKSRILILFHSKQILTVGLRCLLRNLYFPKCWICIWRRHFICW